jgi:alkylation response protein AidB-like acyl-CoA dehydrogenase
MSERTVEQRLEQLLASFPPGSVDARTFLGAQFDAGLAYVWRSPGLGGCDAPRELQGVVDRTLQQAGAPRPSAGNPIGVGMAAPTLASFASETDLRRLLRPLFTGDELWCQMFSEPSAGSDVAALATRAVHDGSAWVVNGQKVWTSLAHLATWGLLLARTDPSAAKHAGLTYFYLDMATPGVEVRPLRQATGDAEFNEVYLTDVRIPDHQRLGDVGDGWRVALTTLMNERVSIGGRVTPRNGDAIGEAVRLWQETGRDDAFRDQLMRLWIRAEGLRLTNERARSQSLKGDSPGPEGSIGKLVTGELNQDIYAFCMELMGAAALQHPHGYDGEFGEEATADVRYRFIRSMANTIEGGTSEIMRNILGERVLGLPTPPRLDKDVPWSQLPR